MHVLSRFPLSICALGAIAAASPAAAVDYSVDFTKAANKDGSFNVMNGNSAAFTVTAAGYNANLSNGSYTISGASVVQYDGGLGVTSSYDDLNTGYYYQSNGKTLYHDCTAGDCNAHQIDNMGNSANSVSVDFVKLTFSQAVSLTSLTRYAFPVFESKLDGSYGWDDDFSISSKAAVASGGANWASLFDNYGNNGGCSASSSLDGSSVCHDTTALTTGKSNVWYVAASVASNYGGDNMVDALKLAGLTVSYVPAAAPEPTSWAMMVIGFGAVGTAIRRRRVRFAAA